eukprot:4711734-Pyramimonas_sp.AAC.1
MVVRLVPRVVVLLIRQEPVAPVRDRRAASKAWQTCICQVSVHAQGFCHVRGERMLTLSAHARHPNTPEGGLVVDPSGCRGIVGLSKSCPFTLVTSTVEEQG